MNIDYVKTPFTNNPSMTRLEGPVYNKNPEKVYSVSYTHLTLPTNREV